MSEEVVSESVEEVSPEPEQEKMLPQSEVNKLVGRTRMEAAERARRQAEAEYQKQLEELQAQKQTHPEQSKEIDEERLYQQIQERMNQELQQKQFEAEMARVADAYTGKMAQGIEKYEDFEKVMSDFEPQAFPQLVYLVADLDNATNIMYELSKNPSKLATIDYLAKTSPKKAQSELANIGSSIAANQQAKEEAGQQSTTAPLDRLQPSRISGNDGQLSIRDLRSQPWLKG